MFETATRVAATETLADPLRVLDGLRLAANLAQARLVFQSGDLWEARVSAALSDPDGDRHADRAAVTDIAVVLGISRTAAHQMVNTMRELVRLPTLDEAFADGCIDYAKTRTITAILRHASSETCAAIEHRVLRDAMHLTPGPLRKAVWTAWMKASPKEAAKVREARRLGDRKVYVRHGEDSMCWLSACSTSIEGWEAQALIDELATGVCEHDPRTMDNRRADALLALLHGDGFLRCQCEDPTCPLATAAPPPRRAHLVEILVGIETLLGLSADPATLPDGTPVDPDVVRILAHDATWRAILTETHTLAHRHHPDIPAATPAPADTAAPVENPTPDPTPPAGTAHREPVAPGAGPTPEPAQSPATAETLADAETPESVDVAVPETNATPPATAAHCEPVAPGAEPAAPVTEPTAESAESPAPAESPADAETPESADVATEAPSTEPDPPALATTAHCEPAAPRAEPATRVETPVPTETTAAASDTAAAATADPVRSQAGAPEPDSAVLASASAPRPDPVASLINTEPPVATALPPDFSPPPDTAPDRADVAPAAVEVDATACQADPAATREHAPAPTATGVNDPVDAPVPGSGPVPVVHGWREEFAEEFGEIAVEYDQDAAVVPPWWPDENSPEPRMPSTPEELEDERLYFEWLEQDVFEDPEPWQVDDGPWPDPPPESGAIPAWLYDPTRPDPIAVLAHPGPGYDPLDGPPILRTSDLGVVAVCSADPEPEPGTGTLPAITYLGIGRKHRRPGAVPPLTYRAPVLPRLPELGIGELIDRLAGHAALHGLRSDDDGHGGLTEPPPGALTYRPSARLAALVRAAYPTCVFPGCARPSCTCELDHRVPFDHRNPRAGGWTIAENLQPLCKGSHQHKTRRQWECFAVPGGIAWRSVTGIVRFTTAASFRTPAPPTDPVPEPDTPRAVAENPPLSQDETDDLVCEPTWWDRHMGENAPPPHPTTPNYAHATANTAPSNKPATASDHHRSDSPHTCEADANHAAG